MHITNKTSISRAARVRGLPASQRGTVLAISLMFLVVLTVIGLGSMSVSSLDERMAGNMRNSDIALQAAETVLREAETWLTAQNLPPGPGEPQACDPNDATVMCVREADFADLLSKDRDWWNANAHPFDSAN